MGSWTPESVTTSQEGKLSQYRGIPVLESGARSRRALPDFIVRLVREKPLGLAGGIIVFILLFSGVLSDVLAPYDRNEIHISDRFAGVSGEYLLGADQLGRDILSRLIYGARVSVIIGLSANITAIVVTAIIGIPSGYFGGKYDMIFQRLVDAWMSFPTLLVLLTVMSIVGRGVFQVILVLGVMYGIGASRIVRSAVINIKEDDYFLAAEAIGSTNARMVARHIIPNIMAPMIIIFTMGLGSMILWEASLSFLGFGLPPEVASWGGMLSWEGRLYMETKPSLALWPGLCLTVVVYGINMFGDALRDLLDPRLRGG